MILNRIFDLFSWSASPNARYGYIILISLISAVIFLWLFKKTSNQAKITAHKNKIFGHILQIPLYQDQFRLLVSSLLNILKYNLLYILQTLVALVFILPPLLILTIQINNRCGYEPLSSGQRFMIRVGVAQETTAATPDVIERIYCETSPGIELETPPLRIVSEGNIYWRAKVANPVPPNTAYIRIGMQGIEQHIEKTIVTNYDQKRFAPVKQKWSWWSALFSNAEGYLRAEIPVKSIATDYFRAGYWFLFWKIDAILLYFIFTLLFALVLKRFFKVTI